MAKFAYGQQPSDITAADLGLGWAHGVRHLKSLSAAGSFWHTHADMQFLYCIRGEFTYEFRDRPPVMLVSGHAIVIPPDTPHRHLQAIDPAGHRVELLVASRVAKQGRHSTIPLALVNELLGRLGKSAFRPIPCNRALTELFVALDALAKRATAEPLTVVERTRARTLLCQVLLDCATPQPAPTTQKSDARLMSAAVEWLEAHFAEDVRLSRLVTYMGYSRARFFVLFRQHTGLTPSAWLTRYRIRQACQLLTKTDKPLAEIARACGFATTQYFSTVFRQLTGTTPTAWRNADGSEKESKK